MEFAVDEKMMMTEEGLDISNHRNVFRAIHKKVRHCIGDITNMQLMGGLVV